MVATPIRNVMGAPVARRGGIYLAAVIARQMAGLLLLAILVATISAPDFTRFGLMVSAFALLVPTLSLNLHLAPARLFFDCTDEAGRANLLKSSLSGALALASLGILATLVALRLTGWQEPVSDGSLELQLGLAFVTVSLVVTQFGANLFRIRGRAGAFFLLVVIQAFGLIAAVLVLGRTVGAGMRSLILAYLTTQLLASSFVLWAGRGLLSQGRLERDALLASFHYSWPTAVHLVALWAITASGRWIGSGYLPLADLAAYTLMTQIVVGIGALGRALFDARLPEMASGFASEEPLSGVRLANQTTALSLALTVMAYAALAALVFVFSIPIPSAYRPTPLLLALAMLANLCDAAYVRGVQILHLSKRTREQAAATVSAGFVTVILSFVLVGVGGDTGLMAAVVIGLSLQAVFSNRRARAIGDAGGGGRYRPL